MQFEALDQLSKTLQPYKVPISIAICIATFGQLLLGARVCKNIKDQGSTDGFSSVPFIASATLGLLNLYLGLMVNDIPTMVTGGAILVFNGLYTLFYFLYDEQSSQEVYKHLTYAMGVIAAIVGYVQWEDEKVAIPRFALALAVLSNMCLALPLKDLKQMIENQEAIGIDIITTITGTIVSFLWMLYGIIMESDLLFVQNITAIALSATEIFLSKLYPTSG